MSAELFAMKDSANITVYSQVTGKPVLYADYGLTSMIDYTAESVYAHNKTVKSVRFDSNREGSFKTEFEIFETKWIALLFGTTLTTKATDIYKREVLTVNTGGAGASLANTPKSGSLSIFKLASATGKVLGTEQTSGNPATTENTYSISGADLTFNATTFASTGYVVAFYILNVSKPSFTVNSTNFPGGYKVIADTAIRGTDQVDKIVQYQLYNVKPKSNVSFGMDVNNVGKLSVEWDILADDNGDMMTYAEPA